MENSNLVIARLTNRLIGHIGPGAVIPLPQAEIATVVVPVIHDSANEEGFYSQFAINRTPFSKLRVFPKSPNHDSLELGGAPSDWCFTEDDLSLIKAPKRKTGIPFRLWIPASPETPSEFVKSAWALSPDKEPELIQLVESPVPLSLIGGLFNKAYRERWIQATKNWLGRVKINMSLWANPSFWFIGTAMDASPLTPQYCPLDAYPDDLIRVWYIALCEDSASNIMLFSEYDVDKKVKGNFADFGVSKPVRRKSGFATFGSVVVRSEKQESNSRLSELKDQMATIETRAKESSDRIQKILSEALAVKKRIEERVTLVAAEETSQKEQLEHALKVKRWTAMTESLITAGEWTTHYPNQPLEIWVPDLGGWAKTADTITVEEIQQRRDESGWEAIQVRLTGSDAGMLASDLLK